MYISDPSLHPTVSPRGPLDEQELFGSAPKAHVPNLPEVGLTSSLQTGLPHPLHFCHSNEFTMQTAFSGSDDNFSFLVYYLFSPTLPINSMRVGMKYSFSGTMNLSNACCLVGHRKCLMNSVLFLFLRTSSCR